MTAGRRTGSAADHQRAASADHQRAASADHAPVTFDRGPAELAGEQARLLACVHCGFCLDACPTYTRLQDEADSPRGRLYLMRALAEGRLVPDSSALRTHLDRCLGCRACEPVCPSGVQYGHLLERVRSTVADRAGIRRLDRLLLRVFGSPFLNTAAGWLGRALRAGGTAERIARLLPARFARLRFALLMLGASRPLPLLPGSSGIAGGQGSSTGGTASAASMPHPSVPQRDGVYAGGSGPRLALLEGCVQKTLFGRVNRATERVFSAQGCTFVTVPRQGCCGALHAHAGDLRGARRLARANVEAFDASGADLIVVNAAGCGAFMKTYGELLEDSPDSERAVRVAGRVRDVSEVLVEVGVRQGAPLPLRVAWDAPCHLIHGQRLVRQPVDVLKAIPDLEIEWVERADECCGGAGTWGLAHPELGGRILEDKVRAVRAAGADVLATANPGCMMQIGAGLRAAGDRMPVVHPIELLAESYRRQGSR